MRVICCKLSPLVYFKGKCLTTTIWIGWELGCKDSCKLQPSVSCVINFALTGKCNKGFKGRWLKKGNARFVDSLLSDRNRRPEGVNGSRSKFLPNSNRRPISQNHPIPQAFWPKFGVAIEELNQHKRPRTSERNHKANWKRIGKLQNWSAWTGLTGAMDRSDRSCQPEQDLTGLTGLAVRSDRWHPENPRKLRFKRWISTKRLLKSINLGESFAPTPWTYPQKISS